MDPHRRQPRYGHEHWVSHIWQTYFHNALLICFSLVVISLSGRSILIEFLCRFVFGALIKFLFPFFLFYTFQSHSQKVDQCRWTVRVPAPPRDKDWWQALDRVKYIYHDPTQPTAETKKWPGVHMVRVFFLFFLSRKNIVHFHSYC